MFSSLLVLSLAALAPLAHATVFVTHPTNAVSIPAGQPFTITWIDDGKTPNLTAFGPCTVGLYVGSVTQQTQLQSIGNVDVSTVAQLSWTPDATVGPNFDSYFIRFTSVSLKDPNQTAISAPEEAFSAKFSLTGMTGTFNSTIQAEISGSASSGAASTAAATAKSTPSGTTATAASTVKPNSAASSAAGSSKSNGAGHMVAPHVLGATGVAAIVFSFFL